MIEVWLFYSLFTFFNTVLPINVEKTAKQAFIKDVCTKGVCTEPPHPL